MRIDAGMDTGEILVQEELAIGPEETAPELAARLAEAGAPLMANTLRGLAAARFEGGCKTRLQRASAPILKREDGRIDWARSVQEIYNRMRRLCAVPVHTRTFAGRSATCGASRCLKKMKYSLLASFQLQKRRRAAALQSNGAGHAGHAADNSEGLRVVLRQGSVLELTSVKLEGRKQVSAAEFARGARLQAAERLGKA